jgi:hypothetical protein
LIHSLIINRIVEALQANLIDNIPADDPAIAGVIMKGPLQGDPDPDEARISVTVHENDPDAIYGGAPTQMKDAWVDEIAEVECGADVYSVFWNRRFTVKARALLVNTGENLEQTREIASTLQTRIVRTLLGIEWNGVADENEYVSRGSLGMGLKAEALQGGGPPDSYDYYVKVRFDIQTCMSL